MKKHGTFKEMVDEIYEGFCELQADSFYFELYFSKKAFKNGQLIPKKAKTKENFKGVQVFYIIGDEKQICLEKTNLLNFQQAFLMISYFAEDKKLGEVLETAIIAE